MTLEEALENVTKASSTPIPEHTANRYFSESLEQAALRKDSEGELNHEYSYIKDVGAELWKLLSRN